VEAVSGDTRASGARALGATALSGDGQPADSLGATRIFEAKDLGKTVIFKPQEKKKPIYGWLVVIDGPDAWEEFRICDEECQLFLGKGEECQFKLPDESLEKMHASLRLKGGTLSLTDLDTTSGTFVNDTPATRTELQDGDRVKAGQNTLRFRKC
jgi:hypothetical protein